MPKVVVEEETLKRHREMYERRLEEIQRRNGKSLKEIVDQANNPANIGLETEEDDEEQV